MKIKSKYQVGDLFYWAAYKDELCVVTKIDASYPINGYYTIHFKGTHKASHFGNGNTGVFSQDSPTYIHSILVCKGNKLVKLFYG
jgi:hypothetical protein